jgi:hypothetical protein
MAACSARAWSVDDERRAPNRVTVTYSLTADEYARYAAAVERRSRSWTTFTISVAVLFSAVPVALLFRTLATQRTHDAEMIEMVGRSSLFAFGLAILACWIGAAISTRLARRKHYKTLANQLGSRTVVLETSGITLTSRTSKSTLQWSAVTGLSCWRDLVLIWIVQGTAIAIPARCFDDDGAREAAKAFARARMAEMKARAGSVPSANPSPT